MLFHFVRVCLRIGFCCQYYQLWSNEMEVFKLPKMSHENIVQFIGGENRCLKNPKAFWIITAYQELGSLHDYLKFNTVTWEQLCVISYTMTRWDRNINIWSQIRRKLCLILYFYSLFESKCKYYVSIIFQRTGSFTRRNSLRKIRRIQTIDSSSWLQECQCAIEKWFNRLHRRFRIRLCISFCCLWISSWKGKIVFSMWDFLVLIFWNGGMGVLNFGKIFKCLNKALFIIIILFYFIFLEQIIFMTGNVHSGCMALLLFVIFDYFPILDWN